MRRFVSALILVGLVGAICVGCGRPRTAIPAGAQVVHVTITGSDVRLQPASVHAGDVYLVLDEPPTGSITFVQRQRAADASPGPLDDDDLERLAHGNTEGTASGGLDAGGCDAEQNAADRGLMGPCGNVMKLVLGAGMYAILGPGWAEQTAEASVDPTAPQGGFVAPRTMAVLVVTP
jgi:hypothetical protein